jgi:hypothetical protein
LPFRFLSSLLSAIRLDRETTPHLLLKMRAMSILAILAALIALSAGVALVKADLPIHCLNAQIAGDWEFTLDAGGNKPKSNGDLSPIACGYPQPDRNADHFTRPSMLVAASTYKVSLTEPNVATDENGTKGIWTMIYDEGFEVIIGGKRFFAFNKYVPNAGTSLSSDKVAHYTSHCDETMVGWYVDVASNSWGCYRGKQTQAQNSWTKAITKVKDDGIDVAPVVSPTGFIEEFYRVMRRDISPVDARKAAAEEETVLLEEDAEVSTGSADEGLISAFEEEADSEIPHPRSHVASELPDIPDDVLFEADPSLIERHNRNAKQHGWRMGFPQQFHKKPVKDMMRMLGLRRYKKDQTGPASRQLRQPIKDNRPDRVKYKGLPKNWDWSDRNGISYDTEIRNQGSCGSCYAMASISALESRFRVKSHLAYRPILAPQEVVSCSFYNQGCEGGYPYLVAKHGTEFGMVDAECHPYTARNSECQPECSRPRLHLTNYSYVGGYMGGCSEVAMMHEIYQNGPVMVAFQAPPDLFYYTGGIYTGPSPKEEAQGVNGVNVWQQTNHAVVAVGWGVDEATGTKYWKLKNTWGLKWGENGYFRIRRGTNECGVESMATKADVVLPASVKIPSDAPNPWAKEKKRKRRTKHKQRFMQSRRRRQERRRRQVDLD